GAAGVGIGAGEGHRAATLHRHAAAAPDAAGIGPGEALVEDQRCVVGDRGALQAVGVADQRAAADIPVLRAGAGQGPDRGTDLVEDGKPAVLLRGADGADVERAWKTWRDLGVSELEYVTSGPEHIATDGVTGRERKRERPRAAREVDGGAAA